MPFFKCLPLFVAECGRHKQETLRGSSNAILRLVAADDKAALSIHGRLIDLRLWHDPRNEVGLGQRDQPDQRGQCDAVQEHEPQNLAFAPVLLGGDRASTT